MEKNRYLSVFTLCCATLLTLAGRASASSGANLNQARNGTDTIPVSPMQFVNGNLGTGTAHYIEGMSVPYNCIMTSLAIGTQVTLTIGYDITNSGKHAIDYLTHYSRILPHVFNVHSTPETINPLSGSGLGSSTSFTTYPIPAPSCTASPVEGQPTNSFNSLTSAERLMTLYNGTIDTIYYGVQGNLNSNSSETQIVVKFTPTAATAVLAWGGHIGSRTDWGYINGSPNSAGGISGSPFHVRLSGWSINNLGNQDRSLSGATVGVPPNPLPIELIRFEAHAQENSNVIEWTTSSEINNDHFTIERSCGSTNFETVALVGGSGNTTTVKNYSWTDNRPLQGTNYYRLIQTDYDGTQNIFGPVAVKATPKIPSLSSFKVFSGRSSGKFYVSFYSANDGEVLLDLFNTEGKTLHSEFLSVHDGTNFIEVSSNELKTIGIYFVQLSNGESKSRVEKIVVH